MIRADIKRCASVICCNPRGCIVAGECLTAPRCWICSSRMLVLDATPLRVACRECDARTCDTCGAKIDPRALQISVKGVAICEACRWPKKMVTK